MNILFICKHNRFRSKVAEYLFKKFNKRTDIHVKSAGLEPHLMKPYMPEITLKILAEKGVHSIDEQARVVNEYDMKWADKIIDVADNVSPDMFPKEKVEWWQVHDVAETNEVDVRKTIEFIERKVKDLVARLGR